MSTAEKQNYEVQKDDVAKPLDNTPPIGIELLAKYTGVDLSRKWDGSKSWSKKFGGTGSAFGVYLSYGPLSTFLDQLPLQKIPMVEMIPGGPKLALCALVFGGIGYAIGKLLESPKP